MQLPENSAKIFEKSAISFLFLLLVSAVWYESDAYRYAAITLVLWGLVKYWRADFRPSVGGMGLACIAWVAFVATRIVIAYAPSPNADHGTAEGIYLLPIFYMTVGYMMFLFRESVGKVAVLFIVISLIMAASTLDPDVFHRGRHEFLMMNNTIHSSVGAGLIVLMAINFASFVVQNVRNAKRRVLYEAIAYATVSICFLGLYGAKSKGVWAAVIAALCSQVLLSGLKTTARRGCLIGLVFFSGLATFAFIFGSQISNTIGPTYNSVSALIVQIAQTGSLKEAVQSVIASGTAPIGVSQRLMLWLNALEVWSHNIAIGNGAGWKEIWAKSQYPDVGYNIIHNGYFEIGVRYGFAGLFFYTMLYVWTVLIARRAYRLGLIPPSAFNLLVSSLIFFLVTISTNSNNRLAIGESYMMVVAAFGFCCYYLCQYSEHYVAEVAETT